MRRTVVSLVSLVSLAVPVAAQSAKDACAAVTKITVGQWAAYRVTESDLGKDDIEMRMAIVGKETKSGAAHYWYEMKMAAPQGSMIVQVLVPGWPYDQSQIAGMIMKAGDQPAMRMPDQMVSMMAQRPGSSSPAREYLQRCSDAEVVGRERVTVPAGSFDAWHLRSSANGGADVWVTKTVPFGVVKMEAKDGTMELLGRGKDAKSSITETPRGM